MQKIKNVLFICMLTAGGALVASEPKNDNTFIPLYRAQLKKVREQLFYLNDKERRLNEMTDNIFKKKAQKRFSITVADTMTIEQIIAALSGKGSLARSLVKKYEKDRSNIAKGIEEERLYHLANIQTYKDGIVLEKEVFKLN